MLNSEFIFVIGIVSTYLRKREKRVNFGNIIVEIQQKWEREREKVGKRKFWISVIWLPKLLLPELAVRVCAVCSKKKPIVAMPLPKMGG